MIKGTIIKYINNNINTNHPDTSTKENYRQIYIVEDCNTSFSVTDNTSRYKYFNYAVNQFIYLTVIDYYTKQKWNKYSSLVHMEHSE